MRCDLYSLAIILIDCFTLIVLLMFHERYCSVVLPPSAMDRSALCDCGNLIILTKVFILSVSVLFTQYKMHSVTEITLILGLSYLRLHCN